MSYATKVEAMTSFIARKRAQLRIYKARVARAERALVAAQRLVEDGPVFDTMRALEWAIS